MLGPFTSKSPAAQSSHFYRCPGCNELVDGGQLSEVLLHHRHVLDAYRFNILRAASMRDENQRAGDLQLGDELGTRT